MLQKGLDLRREQDVPVGDRVVERLDAEVIAGDEHGLPVPVVHEKRKHPVQAFHAFGPVLRVHRQNDFGIGCRAERMAPGLKFRAQLDVVVDLAIEDDSQWARGHGLCARGQVDDGEPLVIEADGSVDVAAFAVRAAMANRIGHVREHGALHGLAVAIDDADDAAHWSGAHKNSHEGPAPARAAGAAATGDRAGRSAFGQPPREARIARACVLMSTRRKMSSPKIRSTRSEQFPLCLEPTKSMPGKNCNAGA